MERGWKDDQRDNKNRHNGHYNGFKNITNLVIGYEVKPQVKATYLGLAPISVLFTIFLHLSSLKKA
nr:MAG TPA: hypothetical protein [Caudoviricetes sp.]